MTKSATGPRNGAGGDSNDLATQLEACYRPMLDAFPDAVTILDLGGRILMANERALELFGAESAAELRGRYAIDLIHPDDRHRAIGDTIRILSGDTVRPTSFRLLRVDGEEVPVEISGAALNSKSGEPEALIGIVHDLRDRTRAEVAERANQATARLVSILSHEFRTPLNSILGFGQLLVAGTASQLDHKQRRYVENILASGRHLLEMADDFLDIAKLRAGRLDVVIRTVEVEPIARQVASLIHPLAAERGLGLSVIVSDGLRVQADARRLAQVLINLLANAVRHTSTGQIVLRCEAVGTEASLQVEDTGIGIPADQFDLIFEEFAQLESLSRYDNHGTGLGLALSRRLAVQMNGSLTVNSTEGTGSVFRLMLPLA